MWNSTMVCRATTIISYWSRQIVQLRASQRMRLTVGRQYGHLLSTPAFVMAPRRHLTAVEVTAFICRCGLLVCFSYDALISGTQNSDTDNSSGVAEMGDRLATIDMGRKVGVCAPFCNERTELEPLFLKQPNKTEVELQCRKDEKNPNLSER